MRFFLDMNVGQSLGELLVRKGHIVEYVRNRDPRMPDSQVLEWATKEKLIIITTDKEALWYFPGLVFRFNFKKLSCFLHLLLNVFLTLL